ncbi:MAG: peptidylprolyl isomerase [Ruminococcaceae bacterium]|nr:peptidylprolyl isomerase [Oscillospiraceae bacterium]
MVFCLYACQTPTSPDVDVNNCYTTELPAAEGRTLFVQFKMSCGATFVVELYPEYAPQTVENFQDLVERGFYNGLTFHRICEGYVIQGGDPKGDGNGVAENPIYGEFSDNGFSQNTLTHERGVISMARRSDDPNSAGTQFFIMHATHTRLDGDYAAFGRVVAGMETIDSIAAVPVKEQVHSAEKSKPVEPPVIESAVFVNYVAEPAE